MDVRWLTAFLDAPAESAAASEVFWAMVTGSTLSARRGPAAERATLLPPDGDAYLRVQVLEAGLAGVHLDLHVGDVADAAERARALGAETSARDAFVVVRSPGGFPFCLVPHEHERIRPAPVGPPGSRSLLDEMCLDISPGLYREEVRFWADLTGWPHRLTGYPEFGFLERAEGMPLRLLLQRLSEGEEPTGAHLDLACDDVATEVARHTGFGAEVVRAFDYWTVMRDPAARTYCLTARNPDTGRLSI